MRKTVYMVEGGVYTDTSWSNIEDGTREVYGPFEDYQQALAVWKSKMGWKIDICCHRLRIVPAQAICGL